MKHAFARVGIRKVAQAVSTTYMRVARHSTEVALTGSAPLRMARHSIEVPVVNGSPPLRMARHSIEVAVDNT